MKLDASAIMLSKPWHRIAQLVFAVATSVALLPMLVWPLSDIARLFCVAFGTIGIGAMMILVSASIRMLFDSESKAEVDPLQG